MVPSKLFEIEDLLDRIHWITLIFVPFRTSFLGRTVLYHGSMVNLRLKTPFAFDNDCADYSGDLVCFLYKGIAVLFRCQTGLT